MAEDGNKKLHKSYIALLSQLELKTRWQAANHALSIANKIVRSQKDEGAKKRLNNILGGGIFEELDRQKSQTQQRKILNGRKIWGKNDGTG